MHQELSERGGNTTLLVIDVQNAVIADAHDRDGVVGRIGKVVDAARETGVPVVYVQHEVPGSGVMERGAEGWHIHPEVAPLSHEPVVYKQYSDSFAETTLASVLADAGTGHLVVTGAQSDACIRSTITRALQEGYDVTLVSDGHTTEDMAFGDVTAPAEHTIAVINAVAPWIAYPETTATVAPHTDVIRTFSERASHASS